MWCEVLKMRICSLSFGNYNPNLIVNNPPYITNVPFYEYMRDNKLDFDNTDLRMFRVVQKKESEQDRAMTGLFCAAAGGAIVSGIILRNKIKNVYSRLKSGIKSAFHR